MQPNTLETLEAWLRRAHIDLALWGQDGHKTLEHLLQEIEKGESVLTHSPPQREVRAATVVIRKNGKILVEDEQVMEDGRTRKRGRIPSEKFLAGEDPSDAAVRCIVEEMGVAEGKIAVDVSSHQINHNRDSSPSYPGLSCLYEVHRFEVEVQDLPEGDFETREMSDNVGDPVSIHRWKWVDENTPGIF